MDQKIHALHASGELFKPDVRKVAMAAARKQYDSDKQRIWTPEWPTHMYAKVGAVIASMVIKLATISVSKEVISEDGSSK